MKRFAMHIAEQDDAKGHVPKDALNTFASMHQQMSFIGRAKTMFAHLPTGKQHTPKS